ncbi:MAG: glycosyltransferase family 39 protein [Candidatus Helarchaeota archaeon]
MRIRLKRCLDDVHACLKERTRSNHKKEDNEMEFPSYFLILYINILVTIFIDVLAVSIVVFLFVLIFLGDRIKKRVKISVLVSFLIFLAIAIAVNLYFYFNSFNISGYDETKYLYVSEQLRRGNIQPLLMFGFLDRPLILFLNAIIFNFIPFSCIVTRTITLVFIIASDIILFYLLKSTFEFKFAFIVSVLFSISFFIGSIFIGEIDIVLTYMFIFSIIFFYKGFNNDDLRYFLLGLLLFNITILVKLIGFTIFPMILSYLFLSMRRKNYTKKLKYASILIAEGIIILIILIVVAPILGSVMKSVDSRLDFADIFFLGYTVVLYFYWIFLNLGTFHSFFNLIMLAYAIFQIWAYKKNRKYFDKFGVLCLIWYFTFYYVLLLEINFFHDFQLVNLQYVGYRYDAPLIFPVYYAIVRLFMGTKDLGSWIRRTNTMTWKRLKRNVLYPLLMLSFVFCLITTFIVDSRFYYSVFDDPRAYGGIILFSHHFNNRNWDNTTILMSENYPYLDIIVFVATGGKYPIITFNNDIDNQSFFDLIELQQISDVILTDWVLNPPGFVYDFLNNSHFVLELSYLENSSTYGLRNSSLFRVIPWW